MTFLQVKKKLLKKEFMMCNLKLLQNLKKQKKLRKTYIGCVENNDWSLQTPPVFENNFLSALVALEALEYVKNHDGYYSVYKLNYKKIPCFNQRPYYCKLLKIFLNKKFAAYIDLRIYLEKYGYQIEQSKKHFGMDKLKCIRISKNDFSLSMPYVGMKDILSKNKIFKYLCKIISVIYFDVDCYPYENDIASNRIGILKKCWGDNFDSFSKKVVEWYRCNKYGR